jgi:hypothetical protein
MWVEFSKIQSSVEEFQGKILNEGVGMRFNDGWMQLAVLH